MLTKLQRRPAPPPPPPPPPKVPAKAEASPKPRATPGETSSFEAQAPDRGSGMPKLAAPEGAPPPMAKGASTFRVNGATQQPMAVTTSASESARDEADQALEDVGNASELAQTLIEGGLSPEAQAELIHKLVDEGVDAEGSLLGVRSLENVSLGFEPGSYDTLVLSSAERQALAKAIDAAHAERPFSEEELLSLAPYLPDLAESATATSDGHVVEAIGEALEARGEEGDAALAAFAFTSSAALIGEHLSTNEDRIQAFETLNTGLPDAFQGLIEGYAEDGQARQAANVARLFAYDTEGLLDHYLKTGNSSEEPLARFFANTLLSPEFANIQVDQALDGKGTQSIKELVSGRLGEYSNAIFERLRQTTEADEADRSQISDELGRLAAAVQGGATILLNEGKSNNATLVNLFGAVLTDVLPPFPGKSTAITAVREALNASGGGGADSAEQYAEELSNTFELALEQIEDEVGSGTLSSSFVSAFTHEHDKLQRELGL